MTNLKKHNYYTFVDFVILAVKIESLRELNREITADIQRQKRSAK